MIDSKSLEILRILQKKARIPNIDVSRQVGLAPSAVLERVKKLEKTKVINGYEVTLNPELFNRSLITYIVPGRKLPIFKKFVPAQIQIMRIAYSPAEFFVFIDRKMIMIIINHSSWT